MGSNNENIWDNILGQLLNMMPEKPRKSHFQDFLPNFSDLSISDSSESDALTSTPIPLKNIRLNNKSSSSSLSLSNRSSKRMPLKVNNSLMNQSLSNRKSNTPNEQLVEKPKTPKTTNSSSLSPSNRNNSDLENIASTTISKSLENQSIKRKSDDTFIEKSFKKPRPSMALISNSLNNFSAIPFASLIGDSPYNSPCTPNVIKNLEKQTSYLCWTKTIVNTFYRSASEIETVRKSVSNFRSQSMCDVISDLIFDETNNKTLTKNTKVNDDDDDDDDEEKLDENQEINETNDVDLDVFDNKNNKITTTIISVNEDDKEEDIEENPIPSTDFGCEDIDTTNKQIMHENQNDHKDLEEQNVQNKQLESIKKMRNSFLDASINSNRNNSKRSIKRKKDQDKSLVPYNIESTEELPSQFIVEDSEKPSVDIDKNDDKNISKDLASNVSIPEKNDNSKHDESAKEETFGPVRSILKKSIVNYSFNNTTSSDHFKQVNSLNDTDSRPVSSTRRKSSCSIFTTPDISSNNKDKSLIQKQMDTEGLVDESFTKKLPMENVLANNNSAISTDKEQQGCLKYFQPYLSSKSNFSSFTDSFDSNIPNLQPSSSVVESESIQVDNNDYGPSIDFDSDPDENVQSNSDNEHSKLSSTVQSEYNEDFYNYNDSGSEVLTSISNSVEQPKEILSDHNNNNNNFDDVNNQDDEDYDESYANRESIPQKSSISNNYESSPEIIITRKKNKNKNLQTKIMKIATTINNDLISTDYNNQLRRSKRTRMKPLDYWRGQRPIYKFENHQLNGQVLPIPTVIGVLKGTELRNIIRRKTTNNNKAHSQQIVEPTNSKRKLEDILNLSIHSKKSTASTLDEENEFVKTFSNLKFKPSDKSKGIHTAIIEKGDKGKAFGMVRFEPYCTKKLGKNGAYSTHFTVLYGVLILKIDSQPDVLLKTGSYFKICPNSEYSIKNIRDDEALLQFSVIKE